MLGNSEQQLMKTKGKTQMKKSWLTVCGVRSYLQRALMLMSVRMKELLH